MKQHIAIIPDDRYPHMWRIRFPDGSLSDRLNHQRAAEVAYAYRRKGAAPPMANGSFKGGGSYQRPDGPISPKQNGVATAGKSNRYDGEPR
jgi:hypothetical protein